MLEPHGISPREARQHTLVELSIVLGLDIDDDATEQAKHPDVRPHPVLGMSMGGIPAARPAR